jgi:hypothetical protein
MDRLHSYQFFPGVHHPHDLSTIQTLEGNDWQYLRIRGAWWQYCNGHCQYHHTNDLTASLFAAKNVLTRTTTKKNILVVSFPYSHEH